MNVADLWNEGIDEVPRMTGALQVMDGRDIVEVAQALKVPYPFGRVLDVGCGTGRASRHCADYTGVDIASDAVAYCQRDGLAVTPITGVRDLPIGLWDLVLCLSVFTHIDRPERFDYLAAFSLRADRLLVDIMPGSGWGDWELWTAVPDEFEADLAENGYRVLAFTDDVRPDGLPRRYYYLAVLG